MPTKDKEKSRAYLRKHYQKNRQYYIDKARRNDKKYQEKVREFLTTYLQSHPCIDCGESDIVVLDFDHKRDKIDSVAVLVQRKCSLVKVKAEVEKCEVRCANCHRRKTARKQKWWKYLASVV